VPRVKVFSALVVLTQLSLALVACREKHSDAPVVVDAAPPPPPQPPLSIDDATAACLSAARTCIAPSLANDFVAALDCMPSEVVQAFGGRAKFLKSAQGGAGYMTSRDAGVSEVRVSSATLASTPSHVFAIVPTTTVGHVGARDTELDSYLFGVSNDGGRTWKFATGNIVSKPSMTSVYPDLPQTLDFPAQMSPRDRPR
jgi:hypothetical protein